MSSHKAAAAGRCSEAGASILRGTLPAAVVLALWLGIGQFHQAHAAGSDSASVAEVTLVIGKAHAIDAEGRSRRLQSGDSLGVGEHIITTASGHVHLHFIDDGRVSVRPDSRLTITDYDYDPAAPEQSTIRFDLEHGVARSISGRGAESARERFRFNTPLAAIGVRGTDFQVQGDTERVRAIVNEGAIVMSAFSGSCLRNGVGPCMEGGVTLQGNTEQALELLKSQEQPRLLRVTMDDVIDSHRSGQQPQGAYHQSNGAHPRDSADSKEGSEVTEESSRSDEKTEAASSDEDNAGTIEGLDGTLVSNDDLLSPDDLLLPPENQENRLALEDRQLAWGRWENGTPAASFVLPADTASDGRVLRVRTKELALFREELDGASLSSEQLGTVGFRLDHSAVTLRQGLQVTPMETSGGVLDIEFGKRAFSTALDLDHDATGPLRFLMEGSVTDGGILIGVSDGGALVGASSLDGQEAAYYFQEVIDQGQIEGTTLWGAK